MADVKVTLNRAAMQQYLNGGSTQALIEQKAARVQVSADAMGSASYRHDTRPGKARCHGIVYTPSEHAIRSNRKHNSLLKALYGGGA